MKRSSLFAAMIFCALVAGTLSHAENRRGQFPTPRYRITDLGAFEGYQSSEAHAINNRGQIVGDCMRQFEGPFCGFIYENGTMKRLPVPDSACESIANDISDNGWIVGCYGKTIHLGQPRAALWKDGKLRPLSDPRGTSLVEAKSINSHGQIVGEGWDRNGRPYAYLWQSGKVSWRSGPDGYAYGVNASGDVAGEAGTGESRAFVYRKGRLVRLKGLGGSNATANAINDCGDAAGIAFTRTGDAHACVWRNGMARDLGLLAGNVSSQAYGINNRGQIVGSSYNGKAPHRAVLWMGGRIYDLNSLLPENSGWTLHDANGINDKGQIVGQGIHNGKVRAYLLSPGSP